MKHLRIDSCFAGRTPRVVAKECLETDKWLDRWKHSQTHATFLASFEAKETLPIHSSSVVLDNIELNVGNRKRRGQGRIDVLIRKRCSYSIEWWICARTSIRQNFSIVDEVRIFIERNWLVSTTFWKNLWQKNNSFTNRHFRSYSYTYHLWNERSWFMAYDERILWPKQWRTDNHFQ